MNFDEYLKGKPDKTPQSVEQQAQRRALTEKFKPTKEELNAQAAESIARGQEIIKSRRNWWETPSYVEAVEKQRKVAEESAEKAAQRAKRQRDAAVLTDVADVFGRMYAQRGANGAWKTPKLSKRSETAEAKYEDALRNRDNVYVDYQGKLATAKLQDYLNKKKQEEAERTYRLAEQKLQKEIDRGKREDALARLQMQLQAGRISEQQYKAEKARVEAEYASKLQQSIIGKNYNTGRKAEYMAYDQDGNEHYFHNKEAAEFFARQNGTWVEDEYESVARRTTEQADLKGEMKPSGTTTTITKKTKNGRSVNPKQKGNKVMPGVSTNNKKMPGIK